MMKKVIKRTIGYLMVALMIVAYFGLYVLKYGIWGGVIAIGALVIFIGIARVLYYLLEE